MRISDWSSYVFSSDLLTPEEFLVLRLPNGLYVQRYAPLLRIAGPYGMLNSRQIRMLAEIARDYDKGFCHISTRTNVHFHWPHLDEEMGRASCRERVCQ